MKESIVNTITNFYFAVQFKSTDDVTYTINNLALIVNKNDYLRLGIDSTRFKHIEKIDLKKVNLLCEIKRYCEISLAHNYWDFCLYSSFEIDYLVFKLDKKYFDYSSLIIMYKLILNLKSNKINEIELSSIGLFNDWKSKLPNSLIKESEIFWRKEYDLFSSAQQLFSINTNAIDSPKIISTNFKINKIDLGITASSLEIKKEALIFSLFVYALYKSINLDDGLVVDLCFDIREKFHKNFIGVLDQYFPVYIESINENISFQEFCQYINNKLLSIKANGIFPISHLNLGNKNTKPQIKFRFLDILEDCNPILNIGSEYFIEGIVFDFINNNSTLNIRISYPNIKTIKRIADGTLRIMQSLLNNLEHIYSYLLKDIDLLSSDESVALQKLGEYELSDNSGKIVLDDIELQAANNGNNIAVSYDEDNISYSELLSRVSDFIISIQNSNIPFQSVIAVLVDKSDKLILALLAIMKTGNIYLPIDKKLPIERIKYILDDSRAKLLITDYELDPGLSKQYHYINIKENHFSTYKKEYANLSPKIMPSHLAYIIYTSGTTGLPKGVKVTHNNLYRLFKNSSTVFSFSDKDTWCLLHSHSFDFSIWEIFGALLYGGKCIIPAPTIITYSPSQLSTFIINQKVTILNQTPSAFYLLAEYMSENKIKSNLKTIILGGEKFLPRKIRTFKLQYPDIKIINMYGITEATVFSTYHILNNNDFASNESVIGKSLPTTGLYILDKYLRILPIGIRGELFISGEGVTDGYINNIELTKEKFISNPYGEGKIYKSGDLVAWNDNLELEYFARSDKQVQSRGYRIELSEIEIAIKEIDRIIDVHLTLINNDDCTDLICAYIQTQFNYTVADIRNKLRTKLPEYMIPPFLIIVDKFPLTVNGKIDISSMPLPNRYSMDNKIDTLMVNSPLEGKIKNCFKTVLNHSHISMDDSFFEVGGNSLTAIRLISEINKVFGVELNISVLFQNSTPLKLSKVLEDFKLISTFPKISKVTHDGQYQASSSQKRLFILNRFYENIDSTYNVYALLKVCEAINTKKLESAVSNLIKRHESLRTYFEFNNNGLFQLIDSTNNCKINKVKIFGNIYNEINNLIRGYDLEKSYLFRIYCIRDYSTNYDYILFDAHHIILDGISLQIVINDFIKLYRSEIALEEVKYQYKDFSEWQNFLISSGVYENQRIFWRNVFNEKPLPLNLITDYVRPNKQEFSGDSYFFDLDFHLSGNIKNYCSKNGLTEYMFFLGCFAILLHKLTNQEDIIIGCTSSGRTTDEVRETVGNFLNMLPMRIAPKKSSTIKQYFSDLSGFVQEALVNQDYPFELIVENIDLERKNSRYPLFDVVFVYQNFLNTEFEHPFELVKDYYKKSAKYDLSLYAFESKDTFNFELEYADTLFKLETIKLYSDFIIQIIDQIVMNDNILLADIRLNSLISKNINSTNINIDKNSIIDTLNQVFDKYSNNIAVKEGCCDVSYKELLNRVNSISCLMLQQYDIKKQDTIVINFEKSINCIATILAIVKIGAIYIPIDSNYPNERICYIYNNVKAKAIFSDKSLNLDAKIITNEEINQYYFSSLIERQHLQVFTEIEPKDLVYIIFTSGTTGLPKGVEIEHRSLSNVINWVNSTFNISESDNVLSLSSISFDLSVYDIFGILSKGGTITIGQSAREVDPKGILQSIINDDITIWNTAPATLNLLEPYFDAYSESLKTSKLRLIFLSGDWIPIQLPNKLKTLFPNAKVISLGGATEATIWSNYYCIDETFSVKNRSIPYGKPIQNCQYYILDEELNECIPGVSGRLFIGGICLARGYYNDHNLTEAKFIFHRSLGRIYDTGDYARLMADSNIEFLGRKDNQIKIRGYRVELKEIESALLKISGIKHTYIRVLKNKNGNELCAYLETDQNYSSSFYRDSLQQFLPVYMIPSYFINLDTFPVSPNGKFNYNEFPEPGKMQIAQEVIGIDNKPNETQRKILSIWKEFLDIESVSIDQNFFDAGGNSLLAVKIISKLEHYLQLDLPTTILFQYPTIRLLAEYSSNLKTHIQPYRENINLNKGKKFLRSRQKAKL